ncbi:MAG: NAD(P)/FAD-dependent oxidoreductase [Gemmatimonadales bacterium]
MSYGEGRVAVVGAGLAGSLMAVYLGRAGYAVDVFEKRPDPRSLGRQEGRSINLAISTRGLAALGRVGLADRVLGEAVQMRGRMMHSSRGKLSFQPYGSKDQAINSVSRGRLNLILIEAAALFPNVTCYFDSAPSDCDIDAGTITIKDEAGGSRTETYDAIIAADGAYSGIRREMLRRFGLSFQQDYLEHGYKELTISPTEDGDHRMFKNALHIWPRGGYMMIALPNFDGSFTCTLFWPLKGLNSFAAITTEAEVEPFFTEHFADAVSLMPTLTADYMSNPTSTLVTIRCWPWHMGKAVLMGDACHAVVPFYGQGANAAFEDCVVLDDCIKECNGDWAEVFKEYVTRRKRHTDTLADLAIGNFIEMRDRVASSSFLIKKKVEKLLLGLVPGFVPLYSMITFSTIPYADALAKSRRQNRIIGWTILSVTVFLAFMFAAAFMRQS